MKLLYISSILRENSFGEVSQKLIKLMLKKSDWDIYLFHINTTKSHANQEINNFPGIKEIKYVPEISTKTVDKKRYYVTPNKVLYPSITTVLSQRGKEGLFEWRKRVGEDVANYIARTSANRGSAVHKMCEDYLNNQHIYNPTDFAKHSRKHFLGYCLFNRLKDQVLKNIDNIYAQETALWSDRLMVAGRVDCIARYKGVPTIIDFKTSRSERTDERNENYYIQATAYS